MFDHFIVWLVKRVEFDSETARYDRVQSVIVEKPLNVLMSNLLSMKIISYLILFSLENAISVLNMILQINN